jgi:tripeptide aminopeptidase
MSFYQTAKGEILMPSPVIERFLRYVTIPSASNPEATSATAPSTPQQMDFARILMEELLALGLQDVQLTPKGHLTATLPGTMEDAPAVGFMAHLDTSPEVSGERVEPRIVTAYDGKEILLHSQEEILLDPREFPELLDYVGEDIIVTDGTTLLGGDDKAGIAAIITLMERLLEHPEIPHGKIRIAFTPDEEIGRGTDHFDISGFGADFAYTVDGGPLGELQYENFNAASLDVCITGRNTHPGTARGKMVNALTLAHKYASLLPSEEVPELTENYEGFFHLLSLHGTVERAELSYILRDFTDAGLSRRKGIAREAAALLNRMYGNRVTLQISDSYKNMRERIEERFEVVELAIRAMEACGVTPRMVPIRGGTDGARLSWHGLPTPNLFTGGHNFHSRYEFLPVASLEKCVEVLYNIALLGADATTSKEKS